MIWRQFLTAGLCVLLFSCGPKLPDLEVKVSTQHVVPPERPAAFSILKTEETSTDWGRELDLGLKFAQEKDYYRALTSFKRALHLIPEGDDFRNRLLELHYHVITSNYHGGQYQAVVDHFENSPLSQVDSSFAPFNDLLVILHDAYMRLGKETKMRRIMKLLEQTGPKRAENLKLSSALMRGRERAALRLAGSLPGREHVIQRIRDSRLDRKSARKAQTLNAVLPGAGYLYLGQKKSAFTSFVLNGLFIAAATHFFEKGHTAAGLITTSFEMGWYLGGIHGAGLYAQEYNAQRTHQTMKQLLDYEELYPVYMLQFSF